MGKIYTALGLMSGTSMDGVDASIYLQLMGYNMIKNLINIMSMIRNFIKI